MMEERQTVLRGELALLLAVVINSLWRGADAPLGLRDLRHFQRALCIF